MHCYLKKWSWCTLFSFSGTNIVCFPKIRWKKFVHFCVQTLCHMTGLISEIPGHQKSLTLIFLLGIIKMGLTNSHLTKYFPVLRECILVLNDTLSFSLVKRLHCSSVFIFFPCPLLLPSQKILPDNVNSYQITIKFPIRLQFSSKISLGHKSLIELANWSRTVVLAIIFMISLQQRNLKQMVFFKSCLKKKFLWQKVFIMVALDLLGLIFLFQIFMSLKSFRATAT